MEHHMYKFLISTVLICGALFSPMAWSASSCNIIFDAGSSGTRLYIFEQQGEQWLSHAGPKVSALADPVREIRGKTWARIRIGQTNALFTRRFRSLLRQPSAAAASCSIPRAGEQRAEKDAGIAPNALTYP